MSSARIERFRERATNNSDDEDLTQETDWSSFEKWELGETAKVLLAEVDRLRAPSGSPMEREDLADLRARIKPCIDGTADAFPIFGWGDLAPVIADRDHHETVADLLKVELLGVRAELERAREAAKLQAEELRSAWEAAAAFEARLAERTAEWKQALSDRDEQAAKVKRMASACFDAGQGCITGETSPDGDPEAWAVSVRDDAFRLHDRVVDIYGDRAEGLGGCYSDAFDMIASALGDLAIAYDRLGAAGYGDGVEEALDVVLARARRCPVTAEDVEQAGITWDLFDAWAKVNEFVPQRVGWTLWWSHGGVNVSWSDAHPARRTPAGGHRGVAEFINNASRYLGQTALDVLGEMAAKAEVSP